MEVERGKNGGKVAWRCIRDIQHGRSAVAPFKLAAIRDENDNVCNTPDMQQQRWRRHFMKILERMEFSLKW